MLRAHRATTGQGERLKPTKEGRKGGEWFFFTLRRRRRRCRPLFHLFSFSHSSPPYFTCSPLSRSKAGSKGSNNNKKDQEKSTEPFAEDVRKLRELRRAERAAAASAPFHKRFLALVQRLWLQYLITWAAYCFDWWERLVVHGCLITVAGLLFYGVSLGVRAARAVVSASGAALGKSGNSGGGLFASSFWPPPRR